jgi:hypothetical protein
MLVGFLVYVGVGLAVTEALGGTVPCFGSAVAACVWALMTLSAGRRERPVIGRPVANRRRRGRCEGPF